MNDITKQETALEELAKLSQETGLYDYPLTGDASFGVGEGPSGENDEDDGDE